MTEPAPAPMRLADGDWHRLHPATPLLRGGLAFVAILGIILVNLRDVVINLVLGAPEDGAVEFVIENGLLPLILLGIVVVLLVCLAGFFLSWRMHSFRITADEVEVRSGILFRTHRRGRLDRIQGVNLVRPLLARLVGTAKLEIAVAGEDANIPLAYLGSPAADDLRREILVLASGAQVAPTEHADAPAAAGIVERRVSELLAPELDPEAVEAESVVKLDLGRLIGSLALSGFTVFLIVAIPLTIVLVFVIDRPGFLFGIVPAAIGIGGYYVSRFTKSLRYSIASTPDGVRVGFGLLTTSNETLPPGRIHAVQVSQPLLWRIPGWWEIKINRAGSMMAAASGRTNTTILPVGNLDEVQSVLDLVLPGIAESRELVRLGLVGKGGEAEFTNSPRRAAVFNWFAWRRNGFATERDVVMLRRGAIWRELQLVPAARLQSLAIDQGPLARGMRLASLRLHTVAGPVSARLGNLDADTAVQTFREIADAAVRAAAADRSHRWRGDAAAETARAGSAPAETAAVRTATAPTALTDTASTEP